MLEVSIFWTCYAKQFRKFRETDNARNNTGISKRGRPKTTWMDNIFQWTGYTLDKILAYTEDRVRWRQLVNGVAKPRSEDV